MKIYFVSSQYEPKGLVAENFAIAKNIFPELESIQGKNSIRETYYYLSSLDKSNEFIWIDADNKVYDEAKSIIMESGPCLLKTNNCFGISYGHGGIKKCKKDIFVRPNVIDVSFYLQLRVIDRVGSFHDLGEGTFKTRSIFAEMLKLALKSEINILQQWIHHCPDIWKKAEYALLNFSANEIQKLITDRNYFRDYYDKNSLLSHL